MNKIFMYRDKYRVSAMLATSPLVVLAPLSAVVLGAIMLGGGIYETLLVDRVWPGNPAVIQPERGGIDRKLFWMPAHTFYELALFITLWTLWSVNRPAGGPLPPWSFISPRARGRWPISFREQFGLKGWATSRKNKGSRLGGGRA
jgi:hypothetical protein